MRQRGFTLIELLAVISIMMLLSSITIANVNDARRAARDAKRMLDTRNILTALQSYYLDYGEWPYMTNAMAASSANRYDSCNVSVCQANQLSSASGETEYYTRCSSVRRCSCGSGPDWPTNWFPLIDGSFSPRDQYFSRQNFPIDPQERSCQYNRALPQLYDYQGYGGSSEGSKFFYQYLLERPNRQAFGRTWGCGSAGCYYAIQGLPDGTIQSADAPIQPPQIP